MVIFVRDYYDERALYVDCLLYGKVGIGSLPPDNPLVLMAQSVVSKVAWPILEEAWAKA